MTAPNPTRCLSRCRDMKDKGNTEIVAEMIAEKTKADLFQILPEVDNYPMTYRALTDVAKQEQDAKARPAYAGEVNDLAGYETIFIGAPVWCDKVSFSSVHLLSGQSTWGLASRAAEPARACLSPCASLRFAHLSIFIVIYFNNQEKGFIL